MKFEYYTAMVYLFEKILPTITDERMKIYSKKSQCNHCRKLEVYEGDETSTLQIYIEKQKECNDIIWVLKIEENCVRCKSYSNETIKLKYITRDADYEITYPTRFKEEHMLKEKCENCSSNLYRTTSGCAGSGSSNEFCKKCGFAGKSMFWD